MRCLRGVWLLAWRGIAGTHYVEPLFSVGAHAVFVAGEGDMSTACWIISGLCVAQFIVFASFAIAAVRISGLRSSQEGHL